ncbi:hypothetical protein SAMN04487920_11319 [Bacillus mycoides]|uniref:hypothetical protein n=1 Tax=Bacillus mycoides TaxID=1405 RepID=UPI0008E6455F|nr:hypothetical protein [Bacillus mycoides]SFQ87212.1 hypothetical protein SAMN04487920_11319 [Bacillus mycoides]
MFLSSSLIIIEVNKGNDLILDNKSGISFSEGKAFYSLTFDDAGKQWGEIHWTQSFLYGTMNIVSFFREENFYYLFTSTPQHYKIFKQIIEQISLDVEISIVKVPRNKEFILPILKDLNSDITDIEYDKNFGFKFNFMKENWQSSVKFYTNGVITYKMNSNIENILEIAKATRILINGVK